MHRFGWRLVVAGWGWGRRRLGRRRLRRQLGRRWIRRIWRRRFGRRWCWRGLVESRGESEMDKDLNELVERLKQAAGSNLKSVVLYGSAASDEFHAKHSDLNVLCVLERLDASELEKLNPPATWWSRKGHPAPLVFTRDELRTSADVFAIRSEERRVGKEYRARWDV